MQQIGALLRLSGSQPVDALSSPRRLARRRRHKTRALALAVSVALGLGLGVALAAARQGAPDMLQWALGLGIGLLPMLLD